MRAILVSACLLMTALAFVPSASADDQQCRLIENQVLVCHSMSDLNDDHSCAIVQVGSGGSGTGACYRYGDEFVCLYFADEPQTCVLTT